MPTSSRTGSRSSEWSATNCAGGTQIEHGVVQACASPIVTFHASASVDTNVACVAPGGGCMSCGGGCGCGGGSGGGAGCITACCTTGCGFGSFGAIASARDR